MAKVGSNHELFAHPLMEVLKPWSHVGIVEVTSDLTDHKPRAERASESESDDCWNSFCPCCRRPLQVRLVPAFKSGAVSSAESPPQEALGPGNAQASEDDTYHAPRESTTPRRAYVSLLYGAQASTGFAMGALVLGQTLRESGTEYESVLMYTNDVPRGVLDVLEVSGLWKLREVDYIHGSHMLGSMDHGGWHGVFTKLHLFSLVEYAQVLFLDLDVLILHNLDEIFAIEPPAATLKGSWQPLHGERIDGRSFFPEKGIWNEPHGGINAGVMLLEPDAEVHRIMCEEVVEEWHPEHIYSYGPEQEYISRYFADRWRHLGLRFNFQLYRLSSSRAACRLLGSAASETPVSDILDQIMAVQFSSKRKPWDFVALPPQEAEQSVRAQIRMCSDEDVGLGPKGEALSLELVRLWNLAFQHAAVRIPPHLYCFWDLSQAV